MTTNTATIERTTVETTYPTQHEECFPNELYRHHGYRVFDRNGVRVGIVDWVWVNELTEKGDHIGLQIQWLRGKARAVPATGAHIDRELGLVRLPFTRQQIASAPRFRIERTLSSELRAAVATHFAHPPAEIGSNLLSILRAKRSIAGAPFGTSYRIAPRKQHGAS